MCSHAYGECEKERKRERERERERERVIMEDDDPIRFSWVSSLCRWCSEGDLRSVRYLVERDEHRIPEIEPVSGRSPLAYAMDAGHKDTVAFLLHFPHTGSVDQEDRYGLRAAEYARLSGHDELAAWLESEFPHAIRPGLSVQAEETEFRLSISTLRKRWLEEQEQQGKKGKGKGSGGEEEEEVGDDPETGRGDFWSTQPVSCADSSKREDLRHVSDRLWDEFFAKNTVQEEMIMDQSRYRVLSVEEVASMSVRDLVSRVYALIWRVRRQKRMFSDKDATDRMGSSSRMNGEEKGMTASETDNEDGEDLDLGLQEDIEDVEDEEEEDCLLGPISFIANEEAFCHSLGFEVSRFRDRTEAVGPNDARRLLVIVQADAPISESPFLGFIVTVPHPVRIGEKKWEVWEAHSLYIDPRHRGISKEFHIVGRNHFPCTFSCMRSLSKQRLAPTIIDSLCRRLYFLGARIGFHTSRSLLPIPHFVRFEQYFRPLEPISLLRSRFLTKLEGETYAEYRIRYELPQSPSQPWRRMMEEDIESVLRLLQQFESNQELLFCSAFPDAESVRRRFLHGSDDFLFPFVSQNDSGDIDSFTCFYILSSSSKSNRGCTSSLNPLRNATLYYCASSIRSPERWSALLLDSMILARAEACAQVFSIDAIGQWTPDLLTSATLDFRKSDDSATYTHLFNFNMAAIEPSQFSFGFL